MKQYLVPLIIIALMVCFSGQARAQFPFFFGPPNPFFFPMPYIGPFVSPFAIFPPLLPTGPFLSTGLAPRSTLSLLSPLRMPQPMLRQAAATITIIFNPTQSIIQVTVLPITGVAAPVTAVAPAVVAPAIAPTALALLPLLTGLAGPQQTKTLTLTRLAPTTVPAVPTLTGLSALLPLI